MLITPEQAAHHLNTDLDEDVDLYTRAAELLAQEVMGRRVYLDDKKMAAAVRDGSAGESPMVINDLVRMGILMILGSLYANRENEVVGVSVAQLPLSSLFLLQPFRVGQGI